MQTALKSHVDLLLAWGFEDRGCLRFANPLYEIDPPVSLANRTTIYAFVLNERVMYIGSADQPKGRLAHYVNLLRKDNSTKARPVYQHLREALASEPVRIYTRLIHHTVAIVDGLPVAMLLGVEAGLIALLRPPWNRRGATKQILHSPLSESMSEIKNIERLIAAMDAKTIHEPK